MSGFSFGDIPTIQSRKALLLLDFQNDFVRSTGALHIPNTPDILEALPQLASAFRRVGDVVWVRSQYQSPQPIADWDFGDRIVLSREPPRKNKIPRTDVIEVASDRDSPEPIDPEAFLSADPSACCSPQTTGYQFPAPILSIIDHQKDTVMDKTGYSALGSPGLVLSFRTRFVTHLYLCGSLSNISVFATALDAVRSGFSVTLVEDCLGFRDFQRHQEAMRRMADILGATGITASELIQELDWDETEAIARQGAPQPKRSATEAGLESVMDGLEVWNAAGATTSEEREPRNDFGLSKLASMSRSHRSSAAQARDPTEEKKGVRARVRRPKRREDPGHPSTGHSHAELGRPTAPQSAPQSVQPYQTGIGEGDSSIVHDVHFPDESFERIKGEVDWQKMYHLSGQVPRLVAVQGQRRSDGAIPIYRHPADESPPFQPFTSTVDEVRAAVEKILGHPLNHVLIQLYRDGQDRISEHSDKTLDIVRGSFICNVSLGAERVMVLRTKTSASETEEGKESGRTSQRVPLPHNSLFVLGPKTNMRWLHGIRADKRPETTKSAAEQAYGGQRISLTFRHIGTFIDPVKNTIWGQGAKIKTLEQAHTVIHGDSTETERLIGAFGQENRATEFDWDAVYGGGFDVVNFVTASPARLILSGDPVADMRVCIALGENGLRYEVIGCEQSQPNQLRPMYQEHNGATVAGDCALLSYLARRSVESARPGVEAVRGGNYLPAIDEFFQRWREHRASGPARSFEFGFEDWERILQGHNYLGGSAFTIDDCSLWPVLREILSHLQGPFDSRFPSLNQYCQRVANRGIVRSILGA